MRRLYQQTFFKNMQSIITLLINLSITPDKY
jgi:hypothetical protein